jgi:hypothetical protein
MRRKLLPPEFPAFARSFESLPRPASSVDRPSFIKDGTGTEC